MLASQPEQTYLQKIKLTSAKPGYFFYLTQQRGFTVYDLTLFNQQTEEYILPIISPLCKLSCIFSQKQFIEEIFAQVSSKSSNNSGNFQYICPKCLNIIDSESLFYQSMLQGILQILKETGKSSIRVTDNMWTVLPLTPQSTWKKIEKTFKANSLSPSQFIRIKNSFKGSNKLDPQTKECLKNYLQYDVLPISQPSSFLKLKKNSNQPSALINGQLYKGTQLTRYKFIKNKGEQLRWLSYDIESQIFIGLNTTRQIYISELSYDQVKDKKYQNSKNVCFFSAHLLYEFKEQQQLSNLSAVKIHLNYEQLYLSIPSFKYLYFQNVLVRSDPSVHDFNEIKFQKASNIENKNKETNQPENTIVNIVGNLWKPPTIYYYHPHHQQILIFQQQLSLTGSIPLKQYKSFNQIDYLSYQPQSDLLSVIDYKNKIMLQVDLPLKEVANVIELDLSESYQGTPVIHKSYLEIINYSLTQSKEQKIFVDRKSLLMF